MGASSSKSSSKPVDMTPTAFKQLQQPFADVVSGLIKNYLPGATTDLTTGYTGPTTTPMSANEGTTLTQLQQLQNSGFSGYQPGAINQNNPNTAGVGNVAQNNFLANTMQGQGVAGSNPDDPLLQAYIKAAQRPTQQALDETLSQDLPGRFVQAGQQTQPQSSSAFDRAAAIATRGSADALAGIATNISYQNQQAGAQRALEASSQTTANAAQGEAIKTQEQQIQTQEVDNTIKNLQAQALPRMIQDLGVERGMDVFNNKINALLATLGIAAGTTRPVISTSSNSSSGGVNLK